MIRAGIVGISGYSGGLTLELLLKHPEVRVTYISTGSTKGKASDIRPQLKGKTNLVCNPFDLKKAEKSCDLVFLAVPQTISMEITPKLLKAKKKVIDLSGDYRLKPAAKYRKWYGTAHKDTANLGKAVYGLPELYRADIQNASLISNPGCYPTAALLALSPLVSTKLDAVGSITIDAKSGVTGAGRKAKLGLIFSEVNENFMAYKVLKHQHTPEIDQYLSKVAGKDTRVTFVAHLLPVNRGIQETIYVPLKKKASHTELLQIYKRFYKTEKFVRVMEKGVQPELKNVVGTNYCDIGLTVSETGDILIITAVIDNLMKGAAGQAVQNMNIMCGFKEETALL